MEDKRFSCLKALGAAESIATGTPLPPWISQQRHPPFPHKMSFLTIELPGSELVRNQCSDSMIERFGFCHMISEGILAFCRLFVPLTNATKTLQMNDLIV